MNEAPAPSKGGAVKGALIRKFGPLPVWGWAIAIGGSVILFRIVTGKGAFPASSGGGGGSGGASGPIIPGSEQSALAQLSASDLAALRDALSGGAGSTPPPATAGGETHAQREERLAQEVIGLRDRLGIPQPTLQKLPPTGGYVGEPSAIRELRLAEEAIRLRALVASGQVQPTNITNAPVN